MSFQRAARTDKGVSAAGQVISLKISYQCTTHTDYTFISFDPTYFIEKKDYFEIDLFF